jgi:hypothetical protein
MRSSPGKVVLQVALLVALLNVGVAAQEPPPPEKDMANTAEGVVTNLYSLVSSEPGTTPDWDKVRAAFIPEAVVVLRTSREGTTVFSVDGFVQDFVTFIERANVIERGFQERVVKVKTAVFHDMAHVLVLYEAFFPDSERPPQQGVDSFLVVKQDGQWKIAAVTNDIPTPEHPVPAELQD